MNARQILVAFSLTLFAPVVQAQFQLPSFEIGLKGGYTAMFDNLNLNNDGVYESLLAQGELNIHLGQRVAVGYFYQGNVILSNYHEQDNGGGQSFDQDGKHLLNGLTLRISTGRSTKFRPYIQGKYFWYEVVVDYGGFRVAGKGNGVSIGAGVMLRLGHKVYINLIEADFCNILSATEVMFDKNNIFPQVRTGLTYNFSKRK